MMKSALHYLHVYPLPKQLTLDERSELLKKFGAEDVRHVSVRGKKQAALAGFKTLVDCRYAVSRLHQLEVLGNRLRASLYKQPVEETLPADKQDVNARLDAVKQFEAQLCALSSKLGFKNPLPPYLKYKYPAINAVTLANICNTIASVPKLYTQVLHLMNKMNLPPPFGATVTSLSETTLEALKLSGLLLSEKNRKESAALESQANLPHSVEESSEGSKLVCHICKKGYFEKGDEESNASSNSLSSDESELQSDSDGEKKKSVPFESRKRKVVNPTNTSDSRKRARLQLKQDKLLQHQKTVGSVPVMQVGIESVFKPENTAIMVGSKMKLNLPTSLHTEISPDEHLSTLQEPNAGDIRLAEQMVTEHMTEPTENDGFGRLQAVKTTTIERTSIFISLQELQNNRVKESEYPLVPVLAKYSPGDPTPRLYLKNLARTVTTQHLHHIFGRYAQSHFEESESFDHTTNPDKYHIRVMQEGRMKGQAFVTLPSAAVAEDARVHTNGYILNDKPMVVMFAKIKQSNT